MPSISYIPPPPIRPLPQISSVVTYKKDSDWGVGYNGSLIINVDKTIKCWQLTCISNNTLSWASDVKYKFDNGTLTIKPEKWAYIIEANTPKIITFGGMSDLSNFVLTEVEPELNDNIDIQPIETIGLSTDDLNSRKVMLNVNEIKIITSMVKLKEVYSNNKNLIDITLLTSMSFSIKGKKNGRGCLKIITETSFRFIGIVVEDGNDISEFPIGMVSEDDPFTSIAFWTDFDELNFKNKRCENRYIYLNGGPGDYGWRNNYTTPEYNLEIPGKRAITFIRNSIKLGMIPVFVYYNIPDGGESYQTNLEHIQSETYMKNYYTDLVYLLDIINKENKDDITRLILEPDFIGYIMQNSGKKSIEIQAYTSVAYTVKGCLIIGEDPIFENNITGLVNSINYIIKKKCKNIEFGWQINAWANPVSIPGGIGICKCSDFIKDFNEAKEFIKKTASDTAIFYKESGIMSNGANFFTVDKYGLDYPLVPAKSLELNPWAFNSDHWNNYLFYVKTISDILNAKCHLWQLPVGHLNTTLTISPYTNVLFSDLPNTAGKAEDSTITFFLGDTFTPTSNTYNYWSQNKWNDPLTNGNGKSITYKSRIKELNKYNITNIMIGAGVGISTTSTGNPIGGIIPGDQYFSIHKIQQSYC